MRSTSGSDVGHVPMQCAQCGGSFVIFRCHAAACRFSGKWFQEEPVLLYASLLEGQGVPREPSAGILSSWLSRKGAAVGDHCCTTQAILARVAYAKGGSNIPGQVGNSLVQTPFCPSR